MCTDYYNRGFTLLEIIVSLVIVGIMATMLGSGLVYSVQLYRTVKSTDETLLQANAAFNLIQLNASSCMERIKAVSKLNYGSMEEIGKIQDVVAQECPGNPTVEFRGATFKNVTDSDGNVSTTVTVNEKVGTCYATSIFCLVTVKINATELNYVFSNNVY